MANNTVNETIRHQDLTDPQITTLQRKIVAQAKVNEYFDRFCEHERWESGSKTLSYRRNIFPKVRPEDVKPAQEGVAPRPTKIAYATFQTSVADYRDKVVYTDESKRYDFDDVVRDSGDTLSYLFTQKLDFIKGKPFLSSKATLTPAATIEETMRKAKIVLSKNKAQHYARGKYLMMTTAEVIDKLVTELEAKGTTLTEATKEELADATIAKRNGFEITECPSPLFTTDDGYQYIVFIGRTPDGKLPVVTRSMGDVEVINNPLGSSVLLDEDGNITSDDNHQQGSIAINAKGLGAAVTDDMCILVCKFKIAEIAGTNLAMSERSEYVSSSGQSLLVLSAVKAEDGQVISDATFEVKENNEKGTAVDANEDKSYTLTAGKKYWYQASGTSYKEVTGYYIADADNRTLVVSLSASEAA